MRRAERRIGELIRQGQAEGTVRRRGQSRGDSAKNKLSPTSFGITPDDLQGNGAGIYQMTDDVTPDQFEAGLAEAKGV